MFDDKTTGRIKTLIYPIQFEKDPVDGLERVFKTVLAPNIMNVPLSEYAETIKIALESSEQLSTLIAKNHSEPTIRRYLVKLLQRIEQMQVAAKKPKFLPVKDVADCLCVFHVLVINA